MNKVSSHYEWCENWNGFSFNFLSCYKSSFLDWWNPMKVSGPINKWTSNHIGQQNWIGRKWGITIMDFYGSPVSKEIVIQHLA